MTGLFKSLTVINQYEGLNIRIRGYGRPVFDQTQMKKPVPDIRHRLFEYVFGIGRIFNLLR
ncbi:MAG: hypothetical protein IPM47_02310 [Sphingobacteriales bacterium]|nr:MAG: hypothetical protein IPM47_02310 [Sphingobacteriales bacterium]